MTAELGSGSQAAQTWWHMLVQGCSGPTVVETDLCCGRGYKVSQSSTPRLIQHFFQDEALRSPEGVALNGPFGKITYAELHGWVEALAGALSRRAKCDKVVAVFMDKSPELVASFLGILAAGKAHTSPALPIEYALVQLQDCECQAALVDEAFLASMDAALLASKCPALKFASIARTPHGDGALGQDRDCHFCLALAPANGMVHDIEELRSAVPTNLLISVGPEPCQSLGDHPCSESSSPDSVAYLMYTSGTTGRPKGVQVAHRGVVRLVKGEDNFHRFSQETAMLFHSPTSFDACIMEIWGPLLNGGRVVPFKEKSNELERMRKSIVDDEVNTVWLTARLFDVIVDQEPPMLAPPIRHVWFGGEAMSHEHVRRSLRRFPNARLMNLYGPTECTVISTYCVLEEVPATDASIIGRPIAHTTCHVLRADLPTRATPHDLAGAALGTDELGELWLGGAGVALGYLGQPDETEARFVCDPWNDGRQLLYRTGDLVKRQADGQLQYHGRKDRQVKINGQRIELDEVRVQLAKLDGAGCCEVLASGGRLLAFGTGPADGEVLRRQLADKLAPHLVPAEVIKVDQLPLTEHGKMDRKALLLLLEKQGCQAQPKGTVICAASPLEDQLLRAFGTALNGISSGLALDSDFVACGGNSLTVSKLTGAIHTQTGLHVPTWAPFQYPTVRTLGAWLEKSQSPSAELHRAPDRPLNDSGTKKVLASFTQENIFKEWLADGKGPRQNELILVEVPHHLDQDQLQWAAQGLVARHEPMRTHFEFSENSEEVLQCIAPVESAKDFTVRSVTLPCPVRLADGKLPPEVERVIAEEWQEPFDLLQRPPFGVVRFLSDDQAVDLSDDQAVDLLLLKAHHAVWDGYSLPLVLKDLQACHTQKSLDIPNRLTYSQYSERLRARLNSGERDRQMPYWLQKLEGAPQLPRLPPSQSPTPVQPGTTSLLQASAHPFALTKRLEGMCQDARVTPFCAVAAAFACVIAKRVRHWDIVLGCPFFNRKDEDVMHLVGFFVNVLALRVSMKEEQTFQRLLQDFKDTYYKAMEHSDVPFHEVLSGLRAKGLDAGTAEEPGDLPFLHAFVNSRDTSRETTGMTVDLGGSQAKVRHWGYSLGGKTTVKYPLILEVDLQRGAYQCALEYDSRLFSRPDIEDMAEGISTLVSVAAARPNTTLAELRDLLGGSAAGAAAALPLPQTIQSPGPEEAPVLEGIERQVAAALREDWRQRLEANLVPLSADFFALGGDSLKVWGVINMLRKQFEVRVEPQDVGNNSRLWQLARFVALRAPPPTLAAPPPVLMAPPPILIAGAGAAGIMAAVECRRRGVPFVVVEKASGPGGVWLHACNETSRLQTPKSLYQLHGDVPFSSESEFPRRQVVLQHMRGVAELHDLLDSTSSRFSTELRSVRRAGDGLTAQLRGPGGQEEALPIRGLLVATGKHSSRPRLLESPEGARVLHSSRLDSEPMRGLRVLVVGGGSGAVEAACLGGSSAAEHVTMLSRAAHWILPTKALPLLSKLMSPTLRQSRAYKRLAGVLRAFLAQHYHEHGLDDLVPKPGYDAFDTSISVSDEFFDLARRKDGRFEFRLGEVEAMKLAPSGDGAVEVRTKGGESLVADLLVSATGYKEPEFPFLADLCRSGRKPSLYRGYLLAEDPRIGFVGFYDMLLSHTKTLPPNICMCLEAILDHSMRPSTRDIEKWLADMPEEVLHGKKAHLEWLFQERRALALARGRLLADRAKWLVQLRPAPAGATPVLALVCLPQGGAGPVSAFRDLAQAAPAGVEVLGVQLPGREARACEASCESLPELAEELARVLMGLPQDTPLALLGFCMGALLGLEVAKRLEDGRRTCKHLVICALGLPGSGDASPARPAMDPELGDQELLQAVSAHTRDARLHHWLTESELGEHRKEIAARLRADLVACRKHRAFLRDVAAGRVDLPQMPITVFAGMDDEVCPRDTVLRWGEIRPRCDVRQLPSCGHLFAEKREFHDELWNVLGIAQVPGHASASSGR